MDNTDCFLPSAALPGRLPDSLWKELDDRAGRRLLKPLYIMRYAGPRAVSPRLAHPYWELTLAMSGQGQVDLARQSVPLASGGGILLPPGCRHRERADQPGWDTLWLGFKGGLPARLGVAKPLALAGGHALRPWVEQLWRWRQRETGASGPELAALTEFLVRAFVRLAHMSRQLPRRPWLAAVQEHIDRHLHRDLAMTELAEVAGRSTGHFQREFRRAIGETPLRHLTRRRLEDAALYLCQSDLPVGEIARTVGFSDPLYFSRVFRRHFGQSPSALREVLPEAHGAGG